MSSLFQAPEWSYDSNIYEVNLRQYTREGTYEAFAASLPRLRSMGVEILWFMPITPISKEKRLGTLGSYYACADYTSSNPEFGTVDDFRNLVKVAHELGFKILIDWVANHTGWGHRWTYEHPDFYRRDQHGNFYDANGWEDVIDLNYDNPDLRKAMIAAMKFWIVECDVDGFRCDMAMLVPLDFWMQARTELDETKKLFWLAECEETGYHSVFDASYTWRFLHRMEAYWRKETNIAGLEEDLRFYQEHFPSDGFHAFFTSNHDENSHSGSEYERMGDAAKPFAVLCCTWNGLPLIYSGQELPNRKRLKFFDKDYIEWTGHNELHDFYRVLLELRKKNKALRAGDPSVLTNRLATSADDRVFAFLRSCEGQQLCVLLNLSADHVSCNLEDAALRGIFKNSFTNEPFDADRTRTLDLAPWSFLVFEK
ncbi:MAG TPA: alpha-amylase family glycosyl hydrolase [Puia sp.]|nr:alpha-amylase family glycosyl hydrolase [Puia sp.]